MLRGEDTTAQDVIICLLFLNAVIVSDYLEDLHTDDIVGAVHHPANWCWEASTGAEYFRMDSPSGSFAGYAYINPEEQRYPLCPNTVITGPEVVADYTLATWTADVLQGSGEYDYAWYSDGVAVGSNSPTYSSIVPVDGFQLSVTVTDRQTDATASDIHNVYSQRCVDNPEDPMCEPT